MDTSARTERDTKADKLNRWRFITKDEAVAFIDAPAMEELRKGHSILSVEQFKTALQEGAIEVLMLPHHGAALVTFGECEEGKCLHILTTTGQMEHANAGLRGIETAARSRGCRVVMSVGRAGWSHLANFRGYTVTPAIIMKKVLHD